MNDILPLVVFWCVPRTAVDLKIASKTANACITARDIDKCLWRNYVCKTISEDLFVKCATQGQRTDLVYHYVKSKVGCGWFTAQPKILKYIFTFDQVQTFELLRSDQYIIHNRWWLLAIEHKCMNVLRIKSRSLYWRSRVITLLRKNYKLEEITWLLENDLITKEDLLVDSV